jgi:hypothetical protein
MRDSCFIDDTLWILSHSRQAEAAAFTVLIRD